MLLYLDNIALHSNPKLADIKDLSSLVNLKFSPDKKDAYEGSYNSASRYTYLVSNLSPLQMTK